MKRTFSDITGVTLTELIVVLAIIAIGAAIALPNMGPWMAARKFNSLTRTMASDFNLARSESIKNANQVNININNSTPGSEWYSMYYAQNGTTTYVVPRKDFPSEINIENMNITGNGSIGFNGRGLPFNNGSFDIVSNKAPSSSNRKTITIGIGGSVTITP